MKDQMILLGEIVSVHGIRGEVILRCHTADPEGIAAYGPLRDDRGQTYTVIPVRAGPKGLVARIAGVDDRTAAEALRGTRLYADRACLPPAEDGSYYVTDLVGLRAFDDEGRDIGNVAAVHNFGAGDILEVKLAGRSGSELLPFSDAFVPSVDLAAGRVTMRLPVPGDENDAPPESEQ